MPGEYDDLLFDDDLDEATLLDMEELLAENVDDDMDDVMGEEPDEELDAMGADEIDELGAEEIDELGAEEIDELGAEEIDEMGADELDELGGLGLLSAAGLGLLASRRADVRRYTRNAEQFVRRVVKRPGQAKRDWDEMVQQWNRMEDSEKRLVRGPKEVLRIAAQKSKAAAAAASGWSLKKINELLKSASSSTTSTTSSSAAPSTSSYTQTSSSAAPSSYTSSSSAAVPPLTAQQASTVQSAASATNASDRSRGAILAMLLPMPTDRVQAIANGAGEGVLGTTEARMIAREVLVNRARRGDAKAVATLASTSASASTSATTSAATAPGRAPPFMRPGLGRPMGIVTGPRPPARAPDYMRPFQPGLPVASSIPAVAVPASVLAVTLPTATPSPAPYMPTQQEILQAGRTRLGGAFGADPAVTAMATVTPPPGFSLTPDATTLAASAIKEHPIKTVGLIAGIFALGVVLAEPVKSFYRR